MQKTVHIQFDKKSKYLGKVDPTKDIKDGHFNIEVSHDEHEDVEKNKDEADFVAKFLGGKSKIDNEKRLEGLQKIESTYPLFGDTDMDTVRQKIKQHGRNPDSLKKGESVHIFTHKHDGNIAQVHYDPHIDKYKVLAKSSSTQGVHLKFFNKVENAHAHAKSWVKKPVNEDMHESLVLDETSVPVEQSLLELSKETLKSYMRANVEDRILRASGASFKSGKAGDEYNKADDTETDEKRKKGMDKAMDKLTKESEQLDELSKNTLKQYTKKATDDLDKKAFHAGHEIGQGDKEAGEDLDAKAQNRKRGIKTAVDKLTKEDLDESKFDTLSLANDALKTANSAKEKMYSAPDRETRSEYKHEYNFNMQQHHALMHKHHSESGESTSADFHKKEHDKFRKAFMNESFGANILASIINNKPIEAQEQFGAAMSSILKTRIDNMRQIVAKNVFNNSEKTD
jgi:hypothetical protein